MRLHVSISLCLLLPPQQLLTSTHVAIKLIKHAWLAKQAKDHLLDPRLPESRSSHLSESEGRILQSYKGAAFADTKKRFVDAFHIYADAWSRPPFYAGSRTYTAVPR